MLCPLLIDPAHPVITDRFKLMAEQPVAFAGLPKSASQDKLEKNKKREKPMENGNASQTDTKPSKKRKTQPIQPIQRIHEDVGAAAFAGHEDVSQWDLA